MSPESWGLQLGKVLAALTRVRGGGGPGEGGQGNTWVFPQHCQAGEAENAHHGTSCPPVTLVTAGLWTCSLRPDLTPDA